MQAESLLKERPDIYRNLTAKTLEVHVLTGLVKLGVGLSCMRMNSKEGSS